MSLLMQNGLLQQAEQKIESNLTAENRADYMKVVVSGMKSAMLGGPDSILAKLKDSKNPISDCVNGAINLCLLMRVHSRNTMPPKALVPAAMTLMLKALDFADQIGLVKIDNAVLVQATHLFTNTIFHKFGLTPQMLHTAAAKVHAITQDPAAMQKVNMAAGLTKHPQAAAVAPVAPQGGTNGAA